MPPITIVRTIVAPGASGAKETIGVGKITRTRNDGSQLVVNFDPPRKDLLDANIGALSDREIEQLGNVE